MADSTFTSGGGGSSDTTSTSFDSDLRKLQQGIIESGGVGGTKTDSGDDSSQDDTTTTETNKPDSDQSDGFDSDGSPVNVGGSSGSTGLTAGDSSSGSTDTGSSSDSTDEMDAGTDSPGPGTPDFDGGSQTTGGTDVSQSQQDTFKTTSPGGDSFESGQDTVEPPDTTEQTTDTQSTQGTQGTQSADNELTGDGADFGTTTPSREQQIQSFIEETKGIDSRDDVTVQDGQIQLTDSGREEREQFVKEQAADQLSEQVNGVIPAEDVVIEDSQATIEEGSTTEQVLRVQQGRKFEARSLELQQQVQAAAIIEEETGQDVDPRNIEDPERIIQNLGDEETTQFNPTDTTPNVNQEALDTPEREESFQTQTTVEATPQQQRAMEGGAADAIQELTTGGLLSEATEATVNQLSQRYSQASQFVGGNVGGAVDTVVRPITGEEGETAAGSFTEDAVTTTGEIGNVPSYISLGESAVEAGEGFVSLAQEGRASEAFAAGGEVAETTARGFQQQAQQDPAGFAGMIAGGFAASAGAGFAAGKGIRFTRQRIRTAGSKTFDIESGEIVNRQTGEFYNPDADTPEEAFTSTQGGRFPGAQNPSLYRRNPAQAVRQQADDCTPASVETRFQQAGATEGTVLKKAIEVEPEGPGVRRAGGFATQAGSYESPGGFAGPELSPNFLGDVNRGSTFSLRPGTPDTGDKATGVLVRTRVDEPDATDLDEFNRELLEREGETTARTKPASEVNTGEAEAVIPPEAEFTDIGNRGIVTDVARRAGVGSDFSVRFGGRRIPFTDRKIGGKKVPIRAVSDPDLVNSNPSNLQRLLRDERAQVGGRGDTSASTRTLGEIRRPIEQPTDRPAPVFNRPGGSSPAIGDTLPSRGSPNTQGEQFPSDEDDSSPRDERPEIESPVVSLPSVGVSGPVSSPTLGSPFDDSPGSPTDSPSDDSGVPGGGGSDTTSPPSDNTTPSDPSRPPETTQPSRGRRLDFDLGDPDEKSDESRFGGAAAESLTNFINPLSGEVLETESLQDD
jgi:hypothetical protein